MDVPLNSPQLARAPPRPRARGHDLHAPQVVQGVREAAVGELAAVELVPGGALPPTRRTCLANTGMAVLNIALSLIWQLTASRCLRIQSCVGL